MTWDLPSKPTQLRGWLPPHPLGKTILPPGAVNIRRWAKVSSLGILPPEEAVELLCGYRNAEEPRRQISAEGIASDLGYHALALAVWSRALEAEGGLRSFADSHEPRQSRLGPTWSGIGT